MSKSTHNLAINAKDNTASAFQSIQARAIAAGNRISKVMGGAIAAAGAYLSFRSIKGGVDELGNLSDMAMKAGTSVEFLTSAATAFNVAGLNIGTDQLVKAMQYLEKATGKTGEGAFFDAIKSLSAIEDPVKRGAEATRLFGRSALELQPLINGGDEVVQKFRTLQSLMPGVSTSAANAGDGIADAMTVAGKGVQSLWLRAIGFVARLWTDDLPGGVRAGVLASLNWVEYALRKTYNSATRWGAKIGSAFQALGNWAVNGYTWEQAWSEYGEVSELIDQDINRKQAENEKRRADYMAKLASLSVDDLANAFGARNGSTAATAEAAAQAAAQRAVRVTNQLIEGGSNAQRRLSILGPDYQNEQKKQTDYLKKIAENTKQTAENIEGGETYQETDLGA